MMTNTLTHSLRALIFLSVVFILPACSYIPWFGDEEEVEIAAREPLELTEFKQEVRLQRHWEVSVGGDSKQKYNRLQAHWFGDRIAFVSNQGRLSVYSIEDAESIWSSRLDEPVSAGVGGNSQYLIVGTLDGLVTALNSSDGSAAWSVNVAGEVIAIAHDSDQLAILRTNDNRILALSISTGERVWSVTQNSPPLTLRGSGLPIVRAGIVYAGMDNGRVIAISADSGNVIWEARVSVPSGRRELERVVDVDGQLAIDDDFVYAASYHGRVVAIDRINGRIVWAREIASVAGLSADDSLVYVTDRDDNIWALEKATGISAWKQSSFLYRQLSAPVWQSGAVLVGDYEGYLHVLSKQNGRIIGRTQLAKQAVYISVLSTPAASYVIDSSGRLAAYSIVPEG